MIINKLRSTLILNTASRLHRSPLYSFSDNGQNEKKEGEEKEGKKRIGMVNWNELKRRIGNGKLSYIPFYLKHLNNEYLNKSVGGLFWKVNNILNYNLKINQFRYQFKNIKYIGMFVLFCLVYSISLILKRIKQKIGEGNYSSLDVQEKFKIKSEMIEKLKNIKEIEIVSIKKTKLYDITLKYSNGESDTIKQYEGDPNKILHYLEYHQANLPEQSRTKVYYRNENYSFSQAISESISFLSPLIGIAITFYIFKRSNPDALLKGLGQGKKNYQIEPMKNIKVKFNDVAGMEQAKKQVTEFVDFLKNSEKYIDIGAKLPKGALLTGPPGTGKTMLAKACAGQAEVSFFYISGSEFVEIFVGLGASKVRQLFAKARRQAPSIIFIDEIDAIGKKRETSRNEEKDSTLNQLLVEMDGFSSKQTVVVLAASNRKDVLDNALTRPGRFDRMVQITLPDIKARSEIFMVHLKPLKIDPERPVQEIAKRLAELSPGFSGADIANLCNQAAIIATRKNQQFIAQKDFEEAAERVTAGYQKKSLVTPKTKERVARHEAGHAVAGWFLRGGDPLVKLTIIPRSKGALGYAQYLPKNAYIKTKDELIDQVAIMLGGLTSEQIFYGNISSGGSDDLQKVYSLTRRMVAQFGMGRQTYNVTMDESTYVRKQSLYLSDLIDKQIQGVLEEAKNRCKDILLQKRAIIQNLSSELLEKETLNNDDILRIMGPRPSFQVVA